MTDWGRATYGDPCRECGYHWSVGPDEAMALVMATPARYAALLGDTDGSQRHPDLAWTAVVYVAHVADNLRIWAERLAALALGAVGPVTPYNQDLLAQARRYDELSLLGALWSLDRATRDWRDAVLLAHAAGVPLVHPERGELSVLDVVRSNSHDAYHHGWDIERTVTPDRLRPRSSSP
ncbi:MAG TPA: hypothetical protein VNC61_15945 [Acidimicrobiales bacterium]|nr:hypothetical protein [Acidimicrobiales bacterium]